MRFSTKSYDERTGLSYFGFRHYAPEIGRWLTRDPAGERDGLHPYAYGGNDPVNRVDPWGLQSDSPGPNDPFPPGDSIGPIEQPGGETLWAGRDQAGTWWTRVCDGGGCETYICDPTGGEWFGSLAMDYSCSPGPCTPQQRVNLSEEINSIVTLGDPVIGTCIGANCEIIIWF
jgi:RHS repeat-associated protein